MTSTTTVATSARQVTLGLLPFTLAIFLGFLAVGVPLPVLPAFAHDRLHCGTVVVGAAVGLQSLATLLTRQLAGRLSDTRGAKRTGLAGFLAAAVAGLCYLAADRLADHPGPGLAILLVGRVVLGLGESLFITALIAWSIARVGAAHTGRAMAWSGIAMYGALALGAPLGVMLEGVGGFRLVAAVAVLCPLLGAGLAVFWRDARLAARETGSFLRVVGAIWMPGLAMALASVGVGTITAFLALRYRAAGWAQPGLALTGFGAAYILVRLFFAGLPDRWGGTRTAMVSLLIEAAGLLALWRAGSTAQAFAGATLTGLGYSLVFPSLGVEAVRRVRGTGRGVVLGAYLACFDLGLAVAGPLAGGVVQLSGLPAAFAAAAVAALVSLGLTAALSRGQQRELV